MNWPDALRALGYVPYGTLPDHWYYLAHEIADGVDPALLYAIREADDRFDVALPDWDQLEALRAAAPKGKVEPFLAAFGWVRMVNPKGGLSADHYVHPWVSVGKTGWCGYIAHRRQDPEPALCFRLWQLRVGGVDTASRRKTRMTGGRWK